MQALPIPRNIILQFESPEYRRIIGVARDPCQSWGYSARVRKIRRHFHTSFATESQARWRYVLRWRIFFDQWEVALPSGSCGSRRRSYRCLPSGKKGMIAKRFFRRLLTCHGEESRKIDTYINCRAAVLLIGNWYRTPCTARKYMTIAAPSNCMGRLGWGSSEACKNLNPFGSLKFSTVKISSVMFCCSWACKLKLNEPVVHLGNDHFQVV